MPGLSIGKAVLRPKFIIYSTSNCAGAVGATAHVHRAVPGGLCGACAAAAAAAHGRAAPRGPQGAPASRRRRGVPRRGQLPRAAAGQPLPARRLPVARVRAAGALLAVQPSLALGGDAGAMVVLLAICQPRPALLCRRCRALSASSAI